MRESYAYKLAAYRKAGVTRLSIGAQSFDDQVQKKLGGKLDVQSSRLAIIPFNGGEKLAYEFCGTYGGNTYYVYLDANSGTELNVFTVVGNQLM